MTSMKKHIAAVLTAATLAVSLTVSATAAAVLAESLRVSSYKGSALKIGEVSGLIVSASDCTAASSAPDVVSVDKVLNRWTATAKGSGTAIITVTTPDGRTGNVTITVGPAAPAGEIIKDSKSSTDLDANLEIRQDMIRLINQTRKANGVSELPVNEALMNAAQTCSDRLYLWHHNREECEAVAAAGYPNGFGSNLAISTGTNDAAQRAVNSWINSPGHFQTMIDPNCDCIGVGVTQHDGITYCYMFVGKPNSINFYS